MLLKMGLPDLIADSVPQYIEIAVAVAADRTLSFIHGGEVSADGAGSDLGNRLKLGAHSLFNESHEMLVQWQLMLTALHRSGGNHV